MAKCNLCTKEAMPGKVYCRFHVHGNTNNDNHNNKFGTPKQVNKKKKIKRIT